MFARLFACGYRAAFRLVGTRSDAEDVAIEAVARAQARWDEVAGYPEAWVVRAATNLALDQVRRGRPRLLSARPEAPDHSVEHRLDLLAALRYLSRRQLEVVLLRYVGDCSEREVAALLGISTGSVKQHASRGLAALRSRMTGYQFDEPTEAGPIQEEHDDVR